jgi:hypothetical protein
MNSAEAESVKFAFMQAVGTKVKSEAADKMGYTTG